MNEHEEESFTAIAQPVREQISPGVHIVEITRAENGIANGKRLIELTLELSPEFWPLQTRVWKTQNSIGVMQSVLSSAGYDIQPGQRFTFGPEQLLSRLCRVYHPMICFLILFRIASLVIFMRMSANASV